MKSILLMRESPFQRYCANQLFKTGILEGVIVEEGTSVPAENLTSREVLSTIMLVARDASSGSLGCGLVRVSNLVNRRRYYGNRAFHESRLLGDHWEFAPTIRVICVGDVHSPRAISYLEEVRPNLIFVHGTRLIQRSMLDALDVPFINLHWGWSPDYRGEGIVSALALEGPAAVGVTVHLLDEGIDSGNILGRLRPAIDPLDNFYSIGLKLTVLGTDLFLKIARDGVRKCDGIPQAKRKGQLFSSRYLRDHPELYRRAWRNLKNAFSR